MIRISPRRHGAALFMTIVIACFLAASAGISARLAYRAADAWNQSLRGAMTVRIISPDTPEATAKAADLMHTAVGIRSARPVTPQRAAALLNGWGGPGVSAADMPTLRLIELDVEKSQATPDFARKLKEQLSDAGFQAEARDHARGVAPAVGHGRIERIAGGVERDLGRQRPARRGMHPAEAAQRVGAAFRDDVGGAAEGL